MKYIFFRLSDLFISIVILIFNVLQSTYFEKKEYTVLIIHINNISYLKKFCYLRKIFSNRH